MRANGPLLKSTLLIAILFVATGAFADTEWNNFNGYKGGYQDFGNNGEATVGEVFSAPQNGDNFLQSFSFYMYRPFYQGDIVLGAYLATWAPQGPLTLLWSSSRYDYANTGQAEITFDTGGIDLSQNPSPNYVIFLSISQYYGESQGAATLVEGERNVGGLSGLISANSQGDFNCLLQNTCWDNFPPIDAAVDLNFNNGVPEPGTLMLLGTGVLSLSGFARRKLF